MSLFNPDTFYVVEQPNAKAASLFAGRAYARGHAIYALDYWSQPLMPLHVTNHSCNPNATFEDGLLIAVREIAAHEEITFDYLAHPLPASPWDFECLCGSENCVGRVSVKATADE